jgi:hypothetical protein
MILIRAFSACALGVCLFHLTSCSSGGGRIDAVNPTVQEMDRLDQQWGLPPRKSRGGPRRSYQYQAPTGAAARSAAPAAAAEPPPRESVNGPPPGGLVPEPSSNTINSLR